MAMRRRDGDRIGNLSSDRLGSASKGKRVPKFFETSTKSGQTDICSQLKVEVLKDFGKLACPH
jgi:hypothetical protein